ncbi:MAG: DUF4834 family protein [Muribaculaceae bacterium]|nr:DUF4834 family protein [Muribaculaceae bacterium]
MIAFLIVLFVLFFVVPRLVVAYAKWKLRRAAQRMQQQMADAFKNQSEAQSRQRRKGGWDAPESKKRYAPTDGEYVEFEEIKVTATTESADVAPEAESKQTIDYKRVVDAQWEDIE